MASLNTGDEVELVGLKEETSKTVVTGIEMFRKILDYAEAGDNIGALLRGVQRTDIERGQVLCKPGSIKPHTKFRGQVYVLKQVRGWPSYSLLQQLSSSVLLQNYRRYRRYLSARGRRDVHAWR